MPGNEHGDRVHNFFAQDNTSQGQHHRLVGEVNWPVQGDNFWIGGQRQIDTLDSNRNSNLPNSEIDGGQGNYSVHVTNSMNFAQSNLRPDFAKNQSLKDNPNFNGFMHGPQFHQARQNEENFMTVETDSDQHQLMTSRGLSVHELQQGRGSDLRAKASLRLETSASSVSFDLFGGQQHHHQSNKLQPLQHQQSGYNNMQQQFTIRKMQELQMQQQLQQMDIREQNMINRVSPFAKQTSGDQSTLVNGALTSDTLKNPWMANNGENWLNQSSPTVQGSENRLVFPMNLDQAHRLVDSVPQQVDQSFYGVPVSNSKGLTANVYPHMMRDRPSVSEMPISNHSLQEHHQNYLLDQGCVQEESPILRQKSQNKNVLQHASNQFVDTDLRNTRSFQQFNSMPRNAPHQDFLGRQELALRPQIWQEKQTTQATSSRSEIALDPTEEKILFGSDDNIWDAFGTMADMNGEADNSFNYGGLSRGLPSIHSGSWSALMQSAVAETSSSHVVPQEESSGLVFNNNDGPSSNQPPLVYTASGKQTSLVDDNVRMPSAMTSGSISFNDISSNNVMGLNKFGHKFQTEPIQRLQTEMSQQFMHFRQPPNDWNAISPGGDRVLNNYETEKSLDSRRNQLRMMQGEVVHGSSLRSANSISSPTEFSGKSTDGHSQTDKQMLSLNDASSVSKTSNIRSGDETSPFVQTNYLLNHWNNTDASARSQGVESLGRMLHQVDGPSQVLDSLNILDKEEVARSEMDSHDVKENSNESHRSNISQLPFGAFGDSGLLDASDSRSLPTGKQNPNNQLTRKVSVPRKFQYHPMGDLNMDVEPTYGLKHSSHHVQAVPQQGTQSVQSNIVGQIPRNYAIAEKGKSSELQRENKVIYNEPSRGSISGYAHISVPFSGPFTSSKTSSSSSSQNMLELLHKVDQSRDHGAMAIFTSECKASSEQHEAEKNDIGRLQRIQSSVSQGFGLQLGPPSQKLPISDDSQNGPGFLHSSHATAEMGEMGQQMVPAPPDPSFRFCSDETQDEFKIKSTNPGNAGHGNSLYQIPGTFSSAVGSGMPYSRSLLETQQIARVSGQILMDQQIESSNGNVSSSLQRVSAENVSPDASFSIKKDIFCSTEGMPQQSAANDVQGRFPAATIPSRDHMQTSQRFPVPRNGNSSQMLQNKWTNAPTYRHTFGAQFQNVPSNFAESLHPNIVESSSALLSQDYIHSQGAQMLKVSSGQAVPAINSHRDPEIEESLGKSSSTKNYSDDTPANSSSTQKDIEAFGRSLKPNSLSHQNSSLLDQMRALKDAETDGSNRVPKRMKGPDNLLDTCQVALKAGQNEQNAIVGDSLGSGTGVAFDEYRRLSFSKPADILQRNISQNTNIPSMDVLALGQSNSFNDCTTSVRVDHAQVSPQMAPSWFNQYGTFENKQVLPMYDSRNATPSRPGKLPFTLGESSSGLDTLISEDKATAVPTDTCQVAISNDNSTPSSVTNGHLSSQSFQGNLIGEYTVTLRPKKRKTATSELHPWHENISESSLNYWTLSKAEAEWSKATNRLSEEVEEYAELIEDRHGRSKRRLILTTQLMQQLLSPAPAAVLSADAISDYESVAYAVSRKVLEDARSMVYRLTELDVPHDDIGMCFANGKLQERNYDRHSAKAIERLMRRSRKLENHILRLDKSISVSDLKVECQDLDKFSVINRFAIFHGRWQADSAATETDPVNATSQKPPPHRYVTAHPVPRNLPDRVQCLSL